MYENRGSNTESLLHDDDGFEHEKRYRYRTCGWVPCGMGGLWFLLSTGTTLAITFLCFGNAYKDLPLQPPPRAGADSDPSSASRVRLRIKNGCSKDAMWIANFAFQTAYFPQDLKLAAGESHDFAIPDAGLAATRFWAKWGCDDSGGGCAIGSSGGPGESCPDSGCAPPLDSKFEATFGCMPGTKDCAHNPSSPSEPLAATDWWDVSQVDGWTLPYKVEVVGKCDGAPAAIDCSELALSQCPVAEDLGLSSGKETLQLMDPSGSRGVGGAVGCYSPCGKLTYAQWGQGHGFATDSAQARDYCCPTPPITPSACSSGPVIKTQYVEAVHRLCPKVYAYAYDDGVGLAQCPAGVRYDVTFFCPL